MNFQNMIKEFLMTFSKHNSLLSSKKIESCISFICGTLVLLSYYIIKAFCLVKCDFSLVDAMAISTAFFTYRGYNTVQIRKDSKTGNPPTS